MISEACLVLVTYITYIILLLCSVFKAQRQGETLRGHIAILDTCGQPALVGAHGLDPAEPWQARPIRPVGPVRLSSPGGSYRLCWCDERCDLPENFRVDFGTMQILGPVFDQHRTCISGQSCHLDIGIFGTWHDLSSTSEMSKVLVLETCAQPSVVAGWGSFTAVGRDTYDTLSTTPSTSLGMSLVTFESVRISAAGGRYEMCWCLLASESCTKPEDFHVGVGTVTVVGPSSLSQEQTCTSGQMCQIQGTFSYTNSQDRLLLASTCGAPALTVLQNVQNGTTTQTASGSMATWSSAPITAEGGQYRLCWCSSFATCSPSDFIDMGELLLLGPSPLEQHRTCVSGLPCEFDGFLGKQLSAQNKILLADTCGVASMPSSQIASLETLGVSAIVSWESLEIAGGVYRLCWCSGDADGADGTQACHAAEDFQTDAGSLTLIGVAPLHQDRTCISGFPCEIDGITGIYTSGNDQFLVLQTCGASTTLHGFPGSATFDQAGSSGGLVSWGPLEITAAGGQYSLCWCADSTDFGNFSCGALCHVSSPFIHFNIFGCWGSLKQRIGLAIDYVIRCN